MKTTESTHVVRKTFPKERKKFTWSEWAVETSALATLAGIRFGDLYAVGGDLPGDIWVAYFQQGLTPEEAVKQATKPYETELPATYTMGTETPWTIADFILSNAEDPDVLTMTAKLQAMKIGETYTIDLGAGGIETVRRVS